MPLAPSPFSSVPQFLNRPAMPIGLTGGPQIPPGQSVPMPGGIPAGPPTQPPPGAGDGGPQEPDIFEKVVRLLMSNPMWMQIFAGMGMREALEKTGKFVSKPHRSNEELAGEGQNVGMPGQTGMPDMAQLMARLQPQSIPGMGPASMPRG